MAEDDYREKLPILQHWNAIATRNLQPPSPASWPTASSIVPAVQTVPAIPTPVAPTVKNTEVERAARYVSPVNTWSTSASGANSYVSSVNHFANNIQSVWPSHSYSSRIQSAPTLTNSPYAYFTLSQGGQQPYTINYSY